jgi:glyoxylase I family protein
VQSRAIAKGGRVGAGTVRAVSDFETRRAQLVEKHLRPADERPASTANGVHHLALICKDVEETIAFYQDVLGFPLVDVMENRDYAGSTHFFIDIGHDNLLAFFDFPGLELGQAVEAIGSVQHLAISVSAERFEELKGRLDQAGIEYIGPDRGLVDSVYFRDPNGVQLELLREPLRQMEGRQLGE